MTTPSGSQWYARQVQRAITSSTVRETGRDPRPPLLRLVPWTASKLNWGLREPATTDDAMCRK